MLSFWLWFRSGYCSRITTDCLDLNWLLIFMRSAAVSTVAIFSVANCTQIRVFSALSQPIRTDIRSLSFSLSTALILTFFPMRSLKTRKVKPSRFSTPLEWSDTPTLFSGTLVPHLFNSKSSLATFRCYIVCPGRPQTFKEIGSCGESPVGNLARDAGR